jgi:hypothetical protein
MNQELKDPVAQALLLTAQNSLDSDQALLKLCNAIADRTNELSDTLHDTIERINEMDESIKNLESKIEVLRDVFYTHITDETDEAKEPN